MENSIWGIKKAAREALKDRWGRAIGITFICFLLGVYSFGPLPSLACTAEELAADPSIVFDIKNTFVYDMAAIRSALFFLLGAGVMIGELRCYFQLTKGELCSYKSVFSGLTEIQHAIVVRVVKWAATFVGLAFLIIPGIYIHYRLALAPWLLADGRAKNAKEALAESAAMMKGKIIWMLALDVSFIGWVIVCCITLGVGFLFLIPYYRCSKALFFKTIYNQSQINN